MVSGRGDYDISADGKQVVMEAEDREGKARLWLTPFDGQSAPRQIPSVEGRNAMFGPSGEIFFRRTEGSSGAVYRVRPDGTGLPAIFGKSATHFVKVTWRRPRNFPLSPPACAGELLSRNKNAITNEAHRV